MAMAPRGTSVSTSTLPGPGESGSTCRAMLAAFAEKRRPKDQRRLWPALILSTRSYERVNLADWLKKVSPNEEVRQKAFGLHVEQEDHFRGVYEVVGEGDE